MNDPTKSFMEMKYAQNDHSDLYTKFQVNRMILKFKVFLKSTKLIFSNGKNYNFEDVISDPGAPFHVLAREKKNRS